MATGVPQGPFPAHIGDLLTTPRPPYIPVISRNEVRDDSGQVISSYQSADGTSFEQVDVFKPGFDPTHPKVIVQKGTYSYISPDGTPVQVSYIADEKGFRPVGTHILGDVPVVPDAPAIEPVPVPAPPRIRARVKTPEPEVAFPAPFPAPPPPQPAPLPVSFPAPHHPIAAPHHIPAPPPVPHPAPFPGTPVIHRGPVHFPAPVPVPVPPPVVPEVVPDSQVPITKSSVLPNLVPLMQSLSTALGTQVTALFAQTPSGYVQLS